MVTRKEYLFGESISHDYTPKYNPKSIVTLNGNSGKIGFTKETLHSHMLLVGSTGSGKTNVIKQIIPQIQSSMNENDVMLVFDSKLDFRAYHRNFDFLISPIVSSKTEVSTPVTWNIFMDLVADGWDHNSIIDNAEEISTVIFSEAIRTSSQQFFPTAAKDIFAAVISGMAFIGAKNIQFRIDHMNNCRLFEYISKLDANRLKRFLNPIPELSGVLKYVGNGTSDQALGVFAELQSVVKRTFLRSFRSDGRFSIRKCVKERKARTLFLEYNPSNNLSIRQIYQLLIDLFIKESLSPNNVSGDVYIVCDEAKMLAHLDHLEDALNYGRSLNVSVIAGIQNVEQMLDIYGEHDARNILSAFQTSICFYNNDSASVKYVKDIFGQNVSAIQYLSPSGKIVEDRYTGCVVEDWDVAGLKLGESIVKMPFEKPFVFGFKKA